MARAFFKRILAFALAAVLLGAMCSCAYRNEYSYRRPYEDDAELYGAEGTQLRSYSALRSAIMSMLSSGESDAQFVFRSYSGSVSEDLASVCLEIRSETPLGAYAVEDITYELSRIVSYYTASVHIDYSRTREELGEIVSVSGVAELEAIIHEAMSRAAPRLVLSLYSRTVDEEFIAEYVDSTLAEEPLLTVVSPKLTVKGYPDTGANRLYELIFDYGGASDSIDALRSELESAALGMESQISDDAEPPAKALAAATALSERTSSPNAEALYAGTAYGAIIEGSNDDRGIALAYKLLCTDLGIDCLVVRGGEGRTGEQERWWNIITVDESSYHVDVSSFADVGPERSFLLSDNDLLGRYVWDMGEYPECGGSLSYRSLVHPETAEPRPQETETGVAPSAQPEISEPPAETETPETSAEPEQSAPPESPEVSPDPDASEPPTDEPEETEPPEPVEPIRRIG